MTEENRQGSAAWREKYQKMRNSDTKMGIEIADAKQILWIVHIFPGFVTFWNMGFSTICHIENTQKIWYLEVVSKTEQPHVSMSLHLWIRMGHCKTHYEYL